MISHDRSRFRRHLLEGVAIGFGVLLIVLAPLLPASYYQNSNVSAATPYELPYLYNNSYWTTKIPKDVALDPQSAQKAAQVAAQARDHYNGLGLNTSDYAPAFFVASPSDPRVNFGSNNCQGKSGAWDTDLKNWLKNVPIPSNAKPSTGKDGEMVIYDPESDTVWNTWVTKNPSPGVWNACWGGRITNASTSNAIFDYPSGTTAAGLEFTAGTIYPHELLAATNEKYDTIQHALHIAMPQSASWGSWSWPANRTDGNGGSYAPHLQQGQRMRLDPNFQIPNNWHPGNKAIAKAMQDYGVVLRDTSGAVNLYGINQSSFPGHANPWSGGAAFDWQQLAQMPLDKLQVLPVDWGKPGTATDYKKYLAPVSVPEASPQQSAGGQIWSQGYEDGFNGWGGSNQGKVGTYQKNTATNIVREGKYSGRFEVRDGDNPIGSGERSEVQGTTENSGGKEGEERWYKWSTYFASPFDTSKGWQLISQWHDTGDGSPPLAFYAEQGKINLVANINSGSSISYGNTMWSTALQTNKWYDFKLRIVWSGDDNKGKVQLWVDGAPASMKASTNKIKECSGNTCTVRTLKPGSAVYYKQGLYRSDAYTATSVVYHDGFVAARNEAGLGSGQVVQPPQQPDPIPEPEVTPEPEPEQPPIQQPEPETPAPEPPVGGTDNGEEDVPAPTEPKPETVPVKVVTPPSKDRNTVIPVYGNITLNHDTVKRHHNISRVDFYFDDNKKPVQSQVRRPYALDTNKIVDKKYVVRQVTHYKDGSKREQRAVLKIHNQKSPFQYSVSWVSDNRQRVQMAFILVGFSLALFGVFAMRRKLAVLAERAAHRPPTNGPPTPPPSNIISPQ